MVARKKIALIVGARPQFIKVLPVISHSVPGYDWLLIHTGQHYDYKMSELFFEELVIPEPEIHLEIEKSSPGKQLAEMVSGLSSVFREAEPVMAVVFGDTNSTLAGTLAASTANIPLTHVEAGMRCFDNKMPEERNRVISDYLADLLLYPTDEAGFNLTAENLAGKAVKVGDPMYQVALDSVQDINYDNYLEKFDIACGNYILVTCHRQKTVDDIAKLGNVVEAVLKFDLPVVFPVHPRTRKKLRAFGLEDKLENADNIILNEPVGYLTSLSLIYNSAAVVTDSGGIQREAYLFDVPTVTLRDETEWPETVEDGANVLVGTETGKITKAVVVAVNRLVETRRPRYSLLSAPPPGERIVNAILSYTAGD
ncbi:MAG: UDP-N-acetylglucosamine 2-epimerase (non-hydrolyzing) [bacterium]|nr:UDP-N-acetylglucosamine 2-epimerase (non-hydrolyzing) [bacterium]